MKSHQENCDKDKKGGGRNKGDNQDIKMFIGTKKVWKV